MKTDWNDVWKRETDLWHQASGKTCDGFWADKKSAEIFARKHVKHHRERLDKTLASLNLSPGMRVLDIGAGPGNLAIPIARKVAQVTCVEPSPGMSQVLAESVAREGLSNVVCIAASWEQADLAQLHPPYDLVVASLSLGMADIRAAVEKMNRACSGEVALFWHGGIPEWEDMPRALWPDLLGIPYHGGPKADTLFMVLYQMGIFPEVRVFTSYFCEIFPAMDEAVDFYLRRFERLEEAHRPAIADYLSAHCQRTDQGLVHGFRHTVMKFSWRPGADPNSKGETL